MDEKKDHEDADGPNRSKEENSKYIDSLADGDLKDFLKYNCKSEALVTTLRLGGFETIGSIGLRYETCEKLEAAAIKEGINVEFKDGGSFAGLYEKMKQCQQSNGM